MTSNPNQPNYIPQEIKYGPTYEQRMQELMAEQDEKNRREEPYAVRSARSAYEQAQERLERVNRPYGGNYSFEEKRAAKEDFEVKEKAFRQAGNTHAREKYLAGLEAEKQARAAERAAQDAKTLAENEGRLREAMRARYPGSDEDFVKDWPELKREHYRRQTLDQMNRPQVARF